MRLYHYTCDHAAAVIRRGVDLLPNRSLQLGVDLVWLTDLAVPMAMELGLTSVILDCDRTAWRVEVSDEHAEWWPAWARRRGVSDAVRYELEAFRWPERWWVSETVTRVLSVEQVRRAS